MNPQRTGPLVPAREEDTEEQIKQSPPCNIIMMQEDC